MLPITNSPINPLFAALSNAENIDDKNLRQLTWLREMEKQQLSDWLSHSLLPPSGSAVQNKNMGANQNLFGASSPRFISDDADASEVDDAGQGGASAVHGDSDRGTAQSDSRAADNDKESDVAGSNRASRNVASTEDHTALSTADAQAGIGSTSANAKADNADAAEETPSARENGERLVTISSDLQKLLSDLGLTTFQVGAAFTPPDEAESAPMTDLAANARETEEEIDGADEQAAGAARDPASVVKSAADTLHAADGQKLRLHAELKDDQAHVWIGADRSLNLTGKKLDDLSEQLQQLFGEQGTPLMSLTFNGRALMDPQTGDPPRKIQKSQGSTDTQLEPGRGYGFAGLDNEHFLGNASWPSIP